LEALKEVLREVIERVGREYESRRVPPSHDLLHVVRVAQLVRLICDEEGVEERLKLLALIAAYLHDIGVAKEGVKENHAAVSARYARELLLGRMEYQDVEMVAAAIEEHSWSGGRSASSIVSAVLQDADRLDALGAVGIARVFAFSGYSGRPFYEAADPFAEGGRRLDGGIYAVDHFYEKLFNIPSSLNTEAARRIARRRIEFMELFLRELRGEVLLEEL